MARKPNGEAKAKKANGATLGFEAKLWQAADALRDNMDAAVDLASAKWGRIESTTIHEASEAPSRAQRILRPGDTIVGTVRPGNGSSALVNDEGLTGSTGFAVLRPMEAFDAGLVYPSATSPDNIDALAHLADGAAYPAVRPEIIVQTTVVIGPASIRSAVSRIILPLMARVNGNEAESSRLAAVRDALIPRLASGTVRVPPIVEATH